MTARVVKAFFSRRPDPAAVRATSAGEVERASLGFNREGEEYVEPRGLRCERIWGPLHDRNQRHGHIELACGLVHPARVAAIARHLDWTPDRVRAAATMRDFDFETLSGKLVGGSTYLRRKGVSRAMLIDVVPVPPPSARPPLRDPDPAVLAPQLHPIELAYLSLLAQSSRVRRLYELRAPHFMRAMHEASVQRLFDHLWDTIHGVAATPTPAPQWQALRAVGRSQRSWRGPDRTAVLFLSRNRLFVQRSRQAQVVDLRGRVISERQVPAMRARTTDGRHVVFFEQAGLLVPGVFNGAAVLVITTDGWVTTVPSRLGVVTPHGGEPEELSIHDHRTGEGDALDVITDRPRPLAYSADGRFAWGGESGSDGVIVDGSAKTFVDVGSIPSPRDDRDESGACAFVLAPDRTWRILTSRGVVFHNTTPILELDVVPRAAAFSPAGDRLALVTADGVEIRSLPRAR